MPTTLITGANKGLGHEAARRLVADGHDVWVAARDPERGRAAAEEGGLDVLVNNAGIVGPRRSVSETRPEDVGEVLATNVLGVIRVTQAFVPLLERSAHPVVVNVSSGMGSIAHTTDPERLESTIVSLGYPTSKAALNMLTTQYAKALPGFRVNAVDPGYTSTDFNDHRGTQSVEEGTDAIVAMANVAADGPTGTFTDRAGSVPW